QPRARDEQRAQREEHRPQREERREAPRDLRNEATVWFTINIGRYKNADPKWLVPLLCRRCNITKRAIGKIQILARETRVEMANDAVVGFTGAIRPPD